MSKSNRLPDRALESRTPPGQYLTKKFPVLTYGPTPKISLDDWSLEVFGTVENEMRLDWTAFRGLETTEIIADFHCVTTWSRLDNRWKGVSSKTLVQGVSISSTARFVMAHCYGGYTTNMPLEVFLDDDVLLAFEHDGETLTPEHGFPVRLVVPSRYAWKSAKWLKGIEFMEKNRPGFWERNGYSDSADPWAEERYW